MITKSQIVYLANDRADELVEQAMKVNIFEGLRAELMRAAKELRKFAEIVKNLHEENIQW